MLAGEAVIAIWNGIEEDARADFYEWHDTEHMPERVGIPGFLRGRRFIAADGATVPEFFTLYEAASFPVLQGQDYANRLNNPTPWTRRVTARFRDTARSLARVVESRGPGMAGIMLTLRFAAEGADFGAVRRLLVAAVDAPRVTGAHLCVTDLEASGVPTTESANRTDITSPPGGIILVEATDAAALAPLFPESALATCGIAPVRRGLYRLEYVRAKTAFAA